jgi:hypothetical protein
VGVLVGVEITIVFVLVAALRASALPLLRLFAFTSAWEYPRVWPDGVEFDVARVLAKASDPAWFRQKLTDHRSF